VGPSTVRVEVIDASVPEASDTTRYQGGHQVRGLSSPDEAEQVADEGALIHEEV
jgi:hypothetical protein